jgi:hypothetical protein
MPRCGETIAALRKTQGGVADLAVVAWRMAPYVTTKPDDG